MLSQATVPVSQAEAKQELARRELARRRLINFAEYIAPWYRTAAVHKLIASKLEQVALYVRTRGRKGIGRLIIEVHPRIGKTELVSKLFPAWLLGNNPDMRIIMASYAADLAIANSKKAKDYVTSPEFAGLFGERAATDAPVVLSLDSRAAREWELTAPHRGGVVAVGVGGGVTGRGGHVLIGDDLFKNRKEAESDAHRKSVWEWWTSSFYTRKEDWAAIVLIMTRWHEDDTIGRLLKSMGTDHKADQYEVVSIPALALDEEAYAQDERDVREGLLRGTFRNYQDPLGRKPGEALWKEKFPREELLKIKANIGPYDWGSLYQQQPKPLSGGFFGGEWQIVDKAPEGLVWCRYWDLAVSEKRTADWTASAEVAQDVDGNWFIRDMIRGRWEWPKARKMIIQIAKDSLKTTIVGIEDVAFQKAAFQDTRNELVKIGRRVKAIKPEGDKFVRAIPLQAAQSVGKVFLVRGPWNGDFIAEAIAFKPDGTSLNDDQIDTVTGGMQMFQRSGKGIWV